MNWLIIVVLLLTGFYFFLIAPRFSKRASMACYRHTLFAHRGYHCGAQGVPENSITAFHAAIEKGYGIELDLHLTKDNQLVVFHDDELTRVCGVSGSIEERTFAQLKNYHLLDTNEHLPLFTDILSLVSGQVPLLIELKIPTPSLTICEITLKALKDYHGPFLIQSFNTMGIRWFKLHASHILRGQLSSNFVSGSSPKPPLLKWFVKHLLTNFLGRPDFISYKLTDLPHPSVTILRQLFHIPVAVWTLRSEKALLEGIEHYDMQIFEKQNENY